MYHLLHSPHLIRKAWFHNLNENYLIYFRSSPSSDESNGGVSILCPTCVGFSDQCCQQDHGFEIFHNFIEANLNCHWDPKLLEAISSLRYLQVHSKESARGAVAPSAVLKGQKYDLNFVFYFQFKFFCIVLFGFNPNNLIKFKGGGKGRWRGEMESYVPALTACFFLFLLTFIGK